MSDSAFGITQDSDAVADPEFGEADISDLVFFLEELAFPQRDLTVAPSETLSEGEMLFAAIGCATCHRPALPTRDGTDVPLYSDLLLHDVGGPNYVGVADGAAAAREMRTPPLWGLRATAPYMHDGLASTIEAAIAAHASEAERARKAYEQLSASDRMSLLSFLRSL